MKLRFYNTNHWSILTDDDIGLNDVKIESLGYFPVSTEAKSIGDELSSKLLQRETTTIIWLSSKSGHELL